MGAADLLSALGAAGLSVSVDAGRLMVSPASRLTDTHRDAIRHHKAELLALLSAPPAAPEGGAATAEGGEGGARSCAQPSAQPSPSSARRAAPSPAYLPLGGRDVLSLIDLAPMDTQELTAGLGWPAGAVSGLVRRLRDVGVIRLRAGRWALTPKAELYALCRKEDQ